MNWFGFPEPSDYADSIARLMSAARAISAPYSPSVYSIVAEAEFITRQCAIISDDDYDALESLFAL